MRHYLRIMPDGGIEDAAAEDQKIRECLVSAPGVNAVGKIERHPRGGYATEIEHSVDDIEIIVAYLHAHGYRLVI